MTSTRRSFLRSGAALTALGITPALLADSQRALPVAVMGHTGRGNFGHGLDTVWLGIPSTRIVAVADPDKGGREKARKKLNLEETRAFADYHEMLAESKPAIVAVCPRHVDQHCDMAVAAAEAGAKGIYMEKPFCRDLAEADAIVKACKENNTKLAIAHRNRYHPVLPVIRDLVDKGELGTLLEVRLRGKEDARGGGLDLWVLGSHLLNLAHYFAGAPTSCSATILQDGRPVTADDVVEGDEGVGPLAGNALHARWSTTSGTPVFFDSIRNAGTREAGFGLQLVGTEGIIDLRADREPLAHLLKGNLHQPTADARSWIPITSAGIGKPEPRSDIRQWVAGHHAAVQDLLQAIEDDRAPLCDDEAGRVVMEMTMGVFASHRADGARVSLPLAERTHPWDHW